MNRMPKSRFYKMAVYFSLQSAVCSRQSISEKDAILFQKEHEATSSFAAVFDLSTYYLF
jgi:hypothetical protein